jgi:hypothetical integral membrane protein (TIGR02206 family)
LGSHFYLFGPVHILILVSVLAVALLLAKASRRNRAAARAIRYALGAFLALNELVWHAYSFHTGAFRFPDGLPLQLCDLTLWLTVLALFTLNPLAFEVAYFAGLGGAGMALLTPDLYAPLVSYPSIYFFVAHGMVVACTLMLMWSGQAWPRPGSPWKAFAVLNVYAVLLGIFNAAFKTNYMYLCVKPVSASLLNVLGPWPVYLLVAEAVALAIFWLLWLPVRHSSPLRQEVLQEP